MEKLLSLFYCLAFFVAWFFGMDQAASNDARAIMCLILFGMFYLDSKISEKNQ